MYLHKPMRTRHKYFGGSFHREKGVIADRGEQSKGLNLVLAAPRL